MISLTKLSRVDPFKNFQDHLFVQINFIWLFHSHGVIHDYVTRMLLIILPQWNTKPNIAPTRPYKRQKKELQTLLCTLSPLLQGKQTILIEIVWDHGNKAECPSEHPSCWSQSFYRTPIFRSSWQRTPNTTNTWPGFDLFHSISESWLKLLASNALFRLFPTRPLPRILSTPCTPRPWLASQQKNPSKSILHSSQIRHCAWADIRRAGSSLFLSGPISRASKRGNKTCPTEQCIVLVCDHNITLCDQHCFIYNVLQTSTKLSSGTFGVNKRRNATCPLASYIIGC